MQKRMFMLVSFLILVLILGFNNYILAKEKYEDGEVIDPFHEVGTLNNEGDIYISKEVTKTDNNGIYQVSLNVKGKDKNESDDSNEKVYAVIVFDRSGSMANYICRKEQIKEGKCTESQKGQIIYKFDNAVNGSKNLAKNLYDNFNAEVAFAIFSDVSVKKGFYSNYDELNNNLGLNSCFGATRLALGLKDANELLDTKDGDNKYIIVISDGAPTDGDAYLKQVEYAKDKGYKIYAVGYEDEGTILKTIVDEPTDKYYYNGTVDNIVSTFENISNSITVPAGTNAVITDEIGNDFSYVDGSFKVDGVSSNPDYNNNSISFNIGDIKEIGTNITFNIKINDNLNPGLYNTNGKVILNYNEGEKVINDSPKVNINGYSYNVNYLEKDTNKKLEKSKVVDGKLLNHTYSEKAINIKGYIVDNKSKDIELVEDNMEVTFYYTKIDNLSYRVEYYYDGVIDDNKTEVYTNILYGTKVDNYPDKLIDGYKFDSYSGDITVADNDGVIKVYYVKEKEESAPNTGIKGKSGICILLGIIPLLFVFIRRKFNV